MKFITPKNIGMVALISTVAFFLLFIVELWFDVMLGNTLVKLGVTYGALMVLLLVVYGIKKTISEEQTAKKDDFIR